MTLRYQCDKCEDVVEPGDCFGVGVFSNDEEGRGRAKVWFYEDGGEKKMGLSITPFVEPSDQQVCGKCLGEMVRAMANELWPEEEEGEVTDPLGVEDMLEFEEKAKHLWNPNFPSAPLIDQQERANGSDADEQEMQDAGDETGSDREDSDVPGVRTGQLLSFAGPAERPHSEAANLFKFDDNCDCRTMDGEGRSNPRPSCPARVHRPG